MEELVFYVYLLASRPCGYLYVGHTDDLQRRMAEHKNSVFQDAYVHKHHIHHLVYYETFSTREAAKRREAILKKLSRAKKFKLVEAANSAWADLAASW